MDEMPQASTPDTSTETSTDNDAFFDEIFGSGNDTPIPTETSSQAAPVSVNADMGDTEPMSWASLMGMPSDNTSSTDTTSQDMPLPIPTEMPDTVPATMPNIPQEMPPLDEEKPNLPPLPHDPATDPDLAPMTAADIFGAPDNATPDIPADEPQTESSGLTWADVIGGDDKDEKA